MIESDVVCKKCCTRYKLHLQDRYVVYECSCGKKTVPRIIVGKKQTAMYAYLALQHKELLLESRGLDAGKLLAVAAILYGRGYFIDIEVVFERVGKDYVPRLFAHCKVRE